MGFDCLCLRCRLIGWIWLPLALGLLLARVLTSSRFCIQDARHPKHVGLRPCDAARLEEERQRRGVW